ncbi:hypothetical protein CVIRNUC_007234 [Coccomyxa viridis]|uniref:Dynein light chain n=1 Tax=Coccomyxa viridis TaxID=1274662 RepID=A0AAV1IAY7_9CHLO|nr:hypothetical protein CVIRNUC_007234 [Coccomyxa viridis]
MAKATSIKEALARVEKESGVSLAQAEKVDLTAQVPSIEKMDASLGVLKACRHLSLSTNNVDRIAGLNGMASLEILSLGRNQVKKLEGFDGISETLQQLWISYNMLEKMVILP